MCAFAIQWAGQNVFTASCCVAAAAVNMASRLPGASQANQLFNEASKGFLGISLIAYSGILKNRCAQGNQDRKPINWKFAALGAAIIAQTAFSCYAHFYNPPFYIEPGPLSCKERLALLPQTMATCPEAQKVMDELKEAGVDLNCASPGQFPPDSYLVIRDDHSVFFMDEVANHIIPCQVAGANQLIKQQPDVIALEKSVCTISFSEYANRLIHFGYKITEASKGLSLKCPNFPWKGSEVIFNDYLKTEYVRKMIEQYRAYYIKVCGLQNSI